jgi:predicted metal-dependent phosphoesterase TrpH
MRIDLHVHTYGSPDSLTRPAEVVRWAQRRGVGVAITDHNTIDVAKDLAATAPIPVIVGEEVMTTRGEIVGLFLRRPVPPGLPPEESIERIHAQGGVVYVPHPFDRLRDSALDRQALIGVLDQVDALEVLNARVMLAGDNGRAAALAAARGLLATAGSDAHTAREIGRTWVELPGFNDASSFLAALAQAKVGGRVSPPWVHLGSRYAHWAKRLGLASELPAK